MVRLELILISVLQFEALVSGKIIYNRHGDDAVLPCAIASSFDPTCPRVSWFHNREPWEDPYQVAIGSVSSVRAPRLSVDTKCSLVIKSVTDEDGGLYTCRQGRKVSEDVYLNVLTISPSEPDADPKRDGEVTLECTLWRYSDLHPCRRDSIRWLDEKRTVLRDKGPGYSFLGQRKCVSVLTVKRQSGHNRRYTCQFVDSRNVTIEAEYTPDFTAVISRTIISLFFRSGQDAILPCANASPADPTCSFVSWIYSKNQHHSVPLVKNGIVASSLARSSRLSVDTKCSLVIKNITAEDVGLYTCRQGRDINQDEHILPNVLTISPSEPDAAPKRDGEVTLECSLWRFNDFFHCPQDSVRWVDETGTKLLDEGVGDSFLRQKNCVSVLTVKRQSDHNRTYTCQFVDDNRVVIEAEYTPDFTDSTGWSLRSYVMLALRIGGLILMIVITVVVIRIRWNKKPLDDDDNVNSDDGGVQYENVEAPRAAARLP